MLLLPSVKVSPYVSLGLLGGEGGFLLDSVCKLCESTFDLLFQNPVYGLIRINDLTLTFATKWSLY